MSSVSARISKVFQSTPSAWRETVFRACQNLVFEFQSTPSAWRETDVRGGEKTRGRHFNPLPPHGGRPAFRVSLLFPSYFNPLPPHGGRPKKGGTVIGWIDISIHSLRMEGDQGAPYRVRVPETFQSTPSAWRETHRSFYRAATNIYFNPLPPHGGRPA